VSFGVGIGARRKSDSDRGGNPNGMMDADGTANALGLAYAAMT
jgi:hypothetical protein